MFVFMMHNFRIVPCFRFIFFQINNAPLKFRYSYNDDDILCLILGALLFCAATFNSRRVSMDGSDCKKSGGCSKSGFRVLKNPI